MVFAQTWSAPAGDAGPLPRQITDRIGTVLRVHMFNHAGAEVIAREDTELTTQELMAKAAYHMSRIQEQNRDIARAALSLAIEREPDNAMALAMRASSALVSVLQQGIARLPDPPDYCLQLAERAVSIAPHVDFVMLTRGCARLWVRADHPGAQADFRRALQISSVFHLAHQFMATSEILSGDHDAGVARMKRVLDLGTFSNPRIPHYLALMALGQFLAGDADAARHTSGEGRDRAPGDAWCAYVHAAVTGERSESRMGGTEGATTGEGLPFSHFRSLPFTRDEDIERLERQLIRAGYPA